MQKAIKGSITPPIFKKQNNAEICTIFDKICSPESKAVDKMKTVLYNFLQEKDDFNQKMTEYRLTKEDLYSELKIWGNELKSKVLAVGCGGTALTLLGYKVSTKDVDFLIPITSEAKSLLRFMQSRGYKEATGSGYKHPEKPWIFDIFVGQRLFQTDLLDPIQEKGKHRVIDKFGKLTLATLNPDDLIISKMFRGDAVDVEDCITLLKSEDLDLQQLAERYKETASYYTHPTDPKKHLKYLIDEMKLEKLDSTDLEEMYKKWKT